MNLIEHVEQSIADVEAGRVALTPEMVEVGGYCGEQWRRLIHRLCKPPVKSYLEIGVLHGAITCCALYGNEIRTCSIDNWLDFDVLKHYGDKEVTRANIERFKGANDATLLTADMYTVDPATLGGPFELFYYDADHSEAGTAFAMGHFLPALADQFILVVDDYGWPESQWLMVRNGVQRGLQEAPVRVLWERELTVPRESHCETWWNGMYLAVVEKCS